MDLASWYQQPLGQVVAAAENAQLRPWLAKLFGYYILQCGAIEQQAWLQSSPILQQLYLQPETTGIKSPWIQADFVDLPFKSNSLDVVLLAHVLEDSTQPQQLLQEVNRVLIPGGHIIILCFNPWSLWRWLDHCRLDPLSPSFKMQWGLAKIERYLLMNDFTIEANKNFLFAPPDYHLKRSPKLDKIERLIQVSWPGLGAVKLMVAKKLAIPLTPLRSRWKLSAIKVVTKKLPAPVTGIRHIKSE